MWPVRLGFLLADAVMSMNVLSFFLHYHLSLTMTSRYCIQNRVLGHMGWPISQSVSQSATGWPLHLDSQCRPVYWWIPARQQLALWFSSAQWHFAAASHPRCVYVCVRLGMCVCVSVRKCCLHNGRPVWPCASVSALTSSTVLLAAGSSLQGWQHTTGAQHIWRFAHTSAKALISYIKI